MLIHLKLLFLPKVTFYIPIIEQSKPLVMMDISMLLKVSWMFLHLTQLELANIIGVSDKTISKWETGKGLPDISLIEPLSKALKVSIIELMSGECITNHNRVSNMLKSKFSVCPICGKTFMSHKNAKRKYCSHECYIKDRFGGGQHEQG